MKNHLRIILMSVLLVVLFSRFVVKGAAVPQSKPAPAEVQISIDNFSFTPQNATLSVGSKVTWKNRDDIPHTVVSNDKVFKSRVLDTDESFSYVFDKPGTYPYFCSVHPKMTGQIVVK